MKGGASLGEILVTEPSEITELHVNKDEPYWTMKLGLFPTVAVGSTEVVFKAPLEKVANVIPSPWKSERKRLLLKEPMANTGAFGQVLV